MHPISRHLYTAVSLLLLITYLFFTFRVPWLEDFWTHAAIVRELSHRPFNPRNPFVIAREPAIPYWPYDAFAAVLSVLLKLEPHHALALLGGVNLLFFLYALKIFTLHFLKEELLPPFALVFVLFCWGAHPWFWSAVYSHQTIFFIAPYPSFFAFALALTTAVHWERGKWKRSFLVLVSTLILLIHPITFIFHILLLSSIALAGRDRDKGGDIAVSLLVSFSIGFIWPYFPLTRLVGDTTFSGDQNARLIYMDVLPRIYPALLGVIPLLILARRSKSVFIYLAAGTGALYLFGYVSQQWNVGRVLPFLVFILQIHLALGLLLLLKAAERRYQQSVLTLVAVAPLIITLSLWSYALLDPSLPHPILRERPVSSEDIRFSKDHLTDAMTVLAESDTSLLIAALGARIVAIDYPPFVGADFEIRARAVRRFFSSETSDDEKKKILDEYKVDLVLIDTQKVSRPALASLPLTFVAEEGRYALFRHLREKQP